MEQTGLHPALEMRLRLLAEQIAALREKMKRTPGHEKIVAFGEIGQLEERHRQLEDQARALDREGPGFKQSVKAEIENLADDLHGTVEDFLLRIDGNFTPGPGTKR